MCMDVLMMMPEQGMDTEEAEARVEYHKQVIDGFQEVRDENKKIQKV